MTPSKIVLHINEQVRIVTLVSSRTTLARFSLSVGSPINFLALPAPMAPRHAHEFSFVSALQ